MKSYYKFPKQLTKWLTKEEIEQFTISSPRYSRRWYDKTFIIKSNGKKSNARYAVFTKGEKVKYIPPSISFINLLLRYLTLKEEGIPIIKTLSRYV